MSRKSGSFYWFFSSGSIFSADSRREKGFQPIKSPYFCLGQQEKENRLKRTIKKNGYFGTCKLANSYVSKQRFFLAILFKRFFFVLIHREKKAFSQLKAFIFA